MTDQGGEILDKPKQEPIMSRQEWVETINDPLAKGGISRHAAQQMLNDWENEAIQEPTEETLTRARELVKTYAVTRYSATGEYNLHAAIELFEESITELQKELEESREHYSQLVDDRDELAKELHDLRERVTEAVEHIDIRLADEDEESVSICAYQLRLIRDKLRPLMEDRNKKEEEKG